MRTWNDQRGPVVSAELVDCQHYVDRRQITIQNAREIHVISILKDLWSFTLLVGGKNEAVLQVEDCGVRDCCIDHREQLRQSEKIEENLVVFGDQAQHT